MRRVSELYDAYRIMPGLQLHQLRVGAVGTLICDSFDGTLDTRAVVLACLFHDMGNIIKSDLTTFPKFLEPQGYTYWKQVKDEFHARYGNDEHNAMLTIGKDIGLSDTVLTLISNVGYMNLERTRDSDSFEQKIVEYADLRVAPYGILPLRERIAEAGTRYIGRHPDMPTDMQRVRELNAAADELERQIFARCAIAATDISDTTTASLIETLRDYEVA
jgi:hypothetical protein